jgi:hypothetical protein
MRRVLAVLLVAAPLVPALGAPKQVGPFTGLFPEGFVVTDAPEPLAPDALRKATLAVVASANLENITKEWVDYYERGGKERQAQTLAMLGVAMGGMGLGASAAGLQQGSDMSQQHGGVVRAASDPRAFTDRIVGALTPYVAKVVTAPDVATAGRQNVDYVAIIDYYGRMYPPAINTRYRSEASVHIFNSSMQRVFSAEGKADLDREGDGFFDGPASIIKGTATTLDKGIHIPTDQILATLQQRLGPPPAPEPVQPAPAPVAAPQRSSMGECIELCKANTSRSAEQCFDACNK